MTQQQPQVESENTEFNYGSWKYRYESMKLGFKFALENENDEMREEFGAAVCRLEQEIQDSPCPDGDSHVWRIGNKITSDDDPKDLFCMNCLLDYITEPDAKQYSNKP
ncbi:MAG: hypothetical protein GY861_08565 [bacterium]|nr:hypothetical protein [bacterium]